MAKVGTFVARILMVGLPTTLGLAAVLFADELRKLPQAKETNRPPAIVRVITLEPIELIPRVTGYGTVTPTREWRAIARVSGEIMDIAPNLAAGDLISKNTQLFTIDDSDLRLDLASIEAQLAAFEVKTETLQASLEIATADLALAQSELARQEQLRTQGVATQTALETARRAELTARTKAVEYENQLKLNAAEREVLLTQKASVSRELGFTDIAAPYDMRITSVASDTGQYVTQGQVLLTGEGIDAVDIAAQFPLGRIGPLLRLTKTQVTDLKARVSLPFADHNVTWKATVARIGEAIDSPTQNAPVVVRVDMPQAQSAAGVRPPLRSNMVVAVDLIAPKITALVVPAEAVSAGTALVVADEKLAKRQVITSFVSGDLAVIESGLEEGDQLVITDPSIAVPGMAAKGVEDEARKAEITALAMGQVPTMPKKPGGGQGGKGAGAQP
ncbi:efflux RND transporter periplasmic adaptor subunit [Celeribacter sp. PS-C1]|uniref:efflux RND transporter periplasmic adaptor subunit n=1 Tax=Celeribacter sp. PS-C1 TaxID=2820813 RepID=UPI001CA52DBF|nr:HlyD family efflux transporter periplasmic adaptor subunit [Celeribacter sp. PS-C1]MBW6416213.1 HlyD family efflux transporter periplasmic adaptor subunit [Celeribacter sp. PS-C1]